MYTTFNFKTKKELKEAVKKYNDIVDMANAGLPVPVAHPVHVYQEGPFGGNEPTNGTVFLEGPHYPEPHRWYAQATLKNGVVVAVK